jgi:ABC-2 type transport system ATP-binding protein
VERLRDEGMTIIYTTHYMEEAERLCDRVAIVDEGRIVALGAPGKLIADLGRGVIYLGTSNGTTNGLVDKIQALPDIQSVARLDSRLKIEVKQAQTALVRLLDLFNRTGTDITSLEVLEPNLETVFLRLTGKHLRD